MIILSLFGIVALCAFIYAVSRKGKSHKKSIPILDNQESKLDYDYSADWDEEDYITPFRLTNQGFEDRRCR